MKITRIQKGEAPPSDTDIRTWCTACGADDQADELIATARAVDSMYLEWRRLHRSGMRKVQQNRNALHERTRAPAPRIPPVRVPDSIPTSAEPRAAYRPRVQSARGPDRGGPTFGGTGSH
ncbi:hypothetical protein GA0115254_11494 [Streptomyces sp. Ncost-T10-10d]|nr:hypothetical protein GA0115254_11494 [Streptomyces sp. Ncost-T10-10d]